MQKGILIVCSALISLVILIFSYSYVDLNLTLNQNTLVLNLISSLQKLGYYNRPLASIIYLTILLTCFAFFSLNLYMVLKRKIDISYLLIASAILTLILIFSYPFLSSDLFNYMFDSKIVVHYHLSPYTHKALDFPQDDWIRFMRWTHRYSPYGPAWLAYASLPTILSFGKFIVNFFLLKIAISVFHLLNAVLIYKILTKINPAKATLGTALYSLNPILILEGVVNAHNDVIVATLMLLSIYFVVNEKKIWSVTSLLIAVLIKYFPLIIAPVTLYKFLGRNLKVEKLIFLNLLILTLFTFIYSTFKISVPFVSSGSIQVQFQPWYLFWTLPLAALLPKKEVIFLTIAISIGASLRYLPFLYYGDWSGAFTIPFMQLSITAPLFFLIIFWALRKLSKKNA